MMGEYGLAALLAAAAHFAAAAACGDLRSEVSEARAGVDVRALASRLLEREVSPSTATVLARICIGTTDPDAGTRAASLFACARSVGLAGQPGIYAQCDCFASWEQPSVLERWADLGRRGFSDADQRVVEWAMHRMARWGHADEALLSILPRASSALRAIVLEALAVVGDDSMAMRALSIARDDVSSSVQIATTRLRLVRLRDRSAGAAAARAIEADGPAALLRLAPGLLCCGARSSVVDAAVEGMIEDASLGVCREDRLRWLGILETLCASPDAVIRGAARLIDGSDENLWQNAPLARPGNTGIDRSVRRCEDPVAVACLRMATRAIAKGRSLSEADPAIGVISAFARECAGCGHEVCAGWGALWTMLTADRTAVPVAELADTWHSDLFLRDASLARTIMQAGLVDEARIAKALAASPNRVVTRWCWRVLESNGLGQTEVGRTALKAAAMWAVSPDEL